MFELHYSLIDCTAPAGSRQTAPGAAAAGNTSTAPSGRWSDGCAALGSPTESPEGSWECSRRATVACALTHSWSRLLASRGTCWSSGGALWCVVLWCVVLCCVVLVVVHRDNRDKGYAVERATDAAAVGVNHSAAHARTHMEQHSAADRSPDIAAALPPNPSSSHTDDVNKHLLVVPTRRV